MQEQTKTLCETERLLKPKTGQETPVTIGVHFVQVSALPRRKGRREKTRNHNKNTFLNTWESKQGRT